ncbi:hypothetical protein TRFO_41885 [Tritrichomonas foetus]|uniref:Uncharacterized protein n=1 Tax=Tritrichomonas foetus TaxID=1144522 RepID=A0A1J4KYT8_9EUKA|nr:hypothetical protein TRFO_41885 [Tritrichomonas foetus]|eukprot:OHT16322.1 hypothetical protein TRFO_41885 [Tritrichomonas foetus]
MGDHFVNLSYRRENVARIDIIQDKIERTEEKFVNEKKLSDMTENNNRMDLKWTQNIVEDESKMKNVTVSLEKLQSVINILKKPARQNNPLQCDVIGIDVGEFLHDFMCFGIHAPCIKSETPIYASYFVPTSIYATDEIITLFKNPDFTGINQILKLLDIGFCTKTLNAALLKGAKVNVRNHSRRKNETLNYKRYMSCKFSNPNLEFLNPPEIESTPVHSGRRKTMSKHRSKKKSSNSNTLSSNSMSSSPILSSNEDSFMMSQPPSNYIINNIKIDAPSLFYNPNDLIANSLLNKDEITRNENNSFLHSNLTDTTEKIENIEFKDNHKEMNIENETKEDEIKVNEIKEDETKEDKTKEDEIKENKIKEDEIREDETYENEINQMEQNSHHLFDSDSKDMNGRSDRERPDSLSPSLAKKVNFPSMIFSEHGERIKTKATNKVAPSVSTLIKFYQNRSNIQSQIDIELQKKENSSVTKKRSQTTMMKTIDSKSLNENGLIMNNNDDIYVEAEAFKDDRKIENTLTFDTSNYREINEKEHIELMNQIPLLQNEDEIINTNDKIDEKEINERNIEENSPEKVDSIEKNSYKNSNIIDNSIIYQSQPIVGNELFESNGNNLNNAVTKSKSSEQINELNFDLRNPNSTDSEQTNKEEESSGHHRRHKKKPKSNNSSHHRSISLHSYLQTVLTPKQFIKALPIFKNDPLHFARVGNLITTIINDPFVEYLKKIIVNPKKIDILYELTCQFLVLFPTHLTLIHPDKSNPLYHQISHLHLLSALLQGTHGNQSLTQICKTKCRTLVNEISTEIILMPSIKEDLWKTLETNDSRIMEMIVEMPSTQLFSTLLDSHFIQRINNCSYHPRGKRFLLRLLHNESGFATVEYFVLNGFNFKNDYGELSELAISTISQLFRLFSMKLMERSLRIDPTNFFSVFESAKLIKVGIQVAKLICSPIHIPNLKNDKILMEKYSEFTLKIATCGADLNNIIRTLVPFIELEECSAALFKNSDFRSQLFKNLQNSDSRECHYSWVMMCSSLKFPKSCMALIDDSSIIKIFVQLSNHNNAVIVRLFMRFLTGIWSSKSNELSKSAVLALTPAIGPLSCLIGTAEKKFQNFPRTRKKIRNFKKIIFESENENFVMFAQSLRTHLSK